jgi:hypothetical protein
MNTLLAGSAPEAPGAVLGAAHWKTLFKTPLDVPGAYDAVIHLRLDALPVQHLAKAIAPPAELLASSQKSASSSASAEKKGYKLPLDSPVSASAVHLSDSTASSSRALPLVAFSPLECLVASLRHLYGSLAYFFFDSQGGSVVAVRWRDEFRARVQNASAEEDAELLKWSVKNSAHSRPVHDKSGRILGLRLHIEEIYADMRAAGEGLIDHIDTAHGRR